MFHPCMFIFSTLLFFALVPGIIFTIPNKSSKKTVALVHALIFSIILSLIHKFVWKVTEGFAPLANPATTKLALQMPSQLKPVQQPATQTTKPVLQMPSLQQPVQKPATQPTKFELQMPSQMPSQMPLQMPSQPTKLELQMPSQTAYQMPNPGVSYSTSNMSNDNISYVPSSSNPASDMPVDGLSYGQSSPKPGSSSSSTKQVCTFDSNGTMSCIYN